MDVSGKPPKWFVVFDGTGRALMSADTVAGEFETVAKFLAAVVVKKRSFLESINVEELVVFASRQAFWCGELRLALDADIDAFGSTMAVPIHVIAPMLPVSTEPKVHHPSAQPAVCVFGSYKTWFVGDEHGVDVEGKHTTLRRRTKTREMVARLDKRQVLMIKSPPMTGKTSLAALICHDLATRRNGQRIVIAAFSFASVRDGETVFGAFKRECQISWRDVEDMGQDGYAVYIVLDEAQRLDDWNGSSPPANGSDEFWRQLKALRRHTRVLLLATYSSNVQYGGYGVYVEFEDGHVLGGDDISFDRIEIQQYVAQCFDGYESLGDTKDRFCELLAVLTGGQRHGHPRDE